MTKLDNVYEKKSFSKKDVKDYVMDNAGKEIRRDKKRRIMFRGSIILSAIAFFVFLTTNSPIEKTYITIDINPSIELVADDDDIVIEANPLNDDAIVLLTDLEVIGLTLKEAAVVIAEEAREMGFIDETSDDNLVLITIYEDDEERQEELAEGINEELEQHFKEKQVDVAIKSQGITPALKDQANEYGISNGKMMYIKKAIEMSGEYTVEELSSLTMKEINGKLKEALKEKIEIKKEERQEIKEAKKAEQELKVEEKKKNSNKPEDKGKDKATEQDDDDEAEDANDEAEDAAEKAAEEAEKAAEEAEKAAEDSEDDDESEDDEDDEGGSNTKQNGGNNKSDNAASNGR